MPPSEKDGRNSGPVPTSALADLKIGDDDFDWDKAIDEWDPTFVAEPAIMPEISGVVFEPAKDKSTSASVQAAKAEPALVDTAQAAATAAQVAETATIAPAPLEADAAPLPPPPPILLEAPAASPIQIEIDLSRAPMSNVATATDSTMAMDAGEMDRLAALLRRPELLPPTELAQPAIPAAVSPQADPADEDFYDNLVLESGRSPKHSQISGAAGAFVRPSEQTSRQGSSSVSRRDLSSPQAVSAPSSASRRDLSSPDLGVSFSAASSVSRRGLPPPEPVSSISAPSSVSRRGLPPPEPVSSISAPSSVSRRGLPPPEPVSSISAPSSVSKRGLLAESVAAPLAASVSARVADSAVVAQATPEGVASAPIPAPVPVMPPARMAASAPIVAVPATLSALPTPAAAAAPLVPRRLPLPALDTLPLPVLTTAGAAAAPEVATRRHFLSLLDAEAAHHATGNKPQAARLAVAAARQSETLREPADALDRYRTALDADPQHRPALRGSRRVLSWPGPTSLPDEATVLLERELGRSTVSERHGLLLTRSELLRSQGQHSAAKASFQEALRSTRSTGVARAAQQEAGASAGGLAALCGILDVAAAQSSTAEQCSALDSLLETYAPKGALHGVLQIQRARLDEAAGQDSAAAQRYEALFTAAGGSGRLSAALGWLRTAVRLSSGKDDQPLHRAYQALLGAPLPVGLRAAVQRQVALGLHEDAVRGSALAIAEPSTDWMMIEELARHHQHQGDHAAAAASYLKLAEISREPLQRCLALTSAGEAHLRAGNAEAARLALLEAHKLAANADLDYDVISGQALERISRVLNKPNDLLALFSLLSNQPADKAAYAHYLAAKALLKSVSASGGDSSPDLGRRAAAIAELQAAVQVRADYAPAVDLLCDLLISDAQYAEAARVLLRAAGALSDQAVRGESIRLRGYAEEAARLLARSGQPAEAMRVLLRDLGKGPTAGASSLLPALRWQLSSIAFDLHGKADVTLVEQAAAMLGAEAEQTPYKHRAAALWYQRGMLLLQHQRGSISSGGLIEQSWQRALISEPGHGPALLGLQLRILAAAGEATPQSPALRSLLETLRLRMEQAMGRPEAMLWALRLAATQENEAADAAGALLTYKQLRAFAGDHSALLGLEDTLFVTAWRAGQAFELVEQRLQQEQDPEQRYALYMLSGELLETQSQSGRAAERFAQALELRPGHPVAKAGLLRAYQNAAMLDELARFTATELKEATDVQTRVAAYERQALLATLRKSETSADEVITAYRHVLTLDTTNHAAMRALERHFIASVQWGELVHLYAQMGLCATDTAFAVHIHLDRARLRQRLVWQDNGDESSLTNELENDYRLALYRDRHCRPALRYLLNCALRKGDLAQVAALSTSVAEICAMPGDFPGTEGGDGRSAAVFLTRAAEALAGAGRPSSEVIAGYLAALKHSREHLPGLRGLLHFAILQRQFAVVADCAQTMAQHLRDTDERYLHYMLAGVVAQELLKDLPRAQQAFLAGLRLVPAREEAFERLRAAYASQAKNKSGAAELAALLFQRLREHQDSAAYKTTLRLELAQLLAGPLGDSAKAKAELRAAVEQAPNHPGALYALGKLLADDEEWSAAVETLERYGELEQRAPQLVALHMLLADIYQDQLKDQPRALSHFTKVLQLQPQNQRVLNRLADLFMAQQKPAGALPILRRLVKYTDDKQKKMAFYHRIAALCELSGDNRGAVEAMRQAVDVDPMHMPAIGELAKFYERQKDVQSMRILLDRTAARFRPLLREKPRDPAVLQALLQIFLWRRSSDLAAMATGALLSLGQSLPIDLRSEVEKLPARKDPQRDGLRDSSIDDILYPARVASGFRTLFRLLAEPLAKLYGVDQKKLAQLGVEKRERLPRSGHPVRDLANKLAADFGVGEFDIYITAAQRKEPDGKTTPLCTIELTDPPALILSSSLLEGKEPEWRFLLGGLLKLLQSNLVLPLSLGPDELGLLIGGLVRQFVPSYVPLGYAEKRIANEAARLKKVIPSKLHGQLLPHAMECSSEALDFEGIGESLLQCSHHMGLLLTTDFASAISALRRKGAAAELYIDELIRFALSDDFAELRRLITRS